MNKISPAILLIGIALACPCNAQVMNAGETKVIFGRNHVLWKQVEVGGKVCSDFKKAELGKLLDVSGSKVKELKQKVNKLKTSAPCRMSSAKSKHGDELVTIENGLVKMVILPRFGGRIIEISNKATGSNIFIDNYSHADTKPDLLAKDPPNWNRLGGWVEGVANNHRDYWKIPHEIKVLKNSNEEILIKTIGKVQANTWGVSGPVSVERTIGIKKGTAHISLKIKLINHTEEEREIRFRPHVRHAIGADIANDEFWFSSFGYVKYGPMQKPHHDHHTTVYAEERIDTWQAIIDRVEREGVIILPYGEINGRMCIWLSTDGKHYTYENTSELREHVVEGTTIEVGHDYAPVFNFDAVAFANPEIAVEFVPEKIHFSPGEKIKAIVGAARISSAAAKKVLLCPKLLLQGKEIAKLKPISVRASLLVAEPKEAVFSIPEKIPAGRYDLVVDVEMENRIAGSFRYQVFIKSTIDAFLQVLRPTDSGFGRGITMIGNLENAQVIVEKSAAGISAGSFKLSNAVLPWTTSITAADDALKVEHTADFSKFPQDALLQSFGFCFPFRLGTHLSKPEIAAERVRHPYQKLMRVTVGYNGSRDEQWLVDHAKHLGEHGFGPYPSDHGGDRFPKWRFGGLLQKNPTTSWTWKSAGYDVAPTVVVQEEKAPGWVDVFSQLTSQGVLVYIPDIAERAPKEIIFDGEIGTVYVYFFPPHVPALSLRKAGRTGKSRAEKWGLGKDKKFRCTFYLYFYSSDITGYLPDKGNVASEVRKIVEGMDKKGN